MQSIYIQCPCCGTTLYVDSNNLFGTIAQIPYANYNDFLSKTQIMSSASYQNLMNSTNCMSFYDQMCNSIKGNKNDV